MKYACFINRKDHLVPLGLCNSEAAAVGTIILGLEDEFADLNTTNEEMAIKFAAQDGVNDKGMEDGFQIDGTCFYGDGSTHFENLVGYALKMEEG